MIRFVWEKYLRDSENVNAKQNTQYVCKTNVKQMQDTKQFKHFFSHRKA